MLQLVALQHTGFSSLNNGTHWALVRPCGSSRVSVAWPIPVSTTPWARGPRCRATEAKRWSALGA